MDERNINKFINNIKNKLKKNKQTSKQDFSDYAFSNEELENIKNENKQKIKELKQDILTPKKKPINKEEVLTRIETENEITQTQTDTTKNQEEEKELLKEEQLEAPTPKNSFLHLTEETQQLVMDKWSKIKPNKIDKDIIDGKDLLNHNYTITYADEAFKFINYIRKEYEIIICYLIGFNNEKQGILNQTTFSNKKDEEWKYLNNYIKILEKIRNFKK